jgi:acyl-CoA thioester hydrolase
MTDAKPPRPQALPRSEFSHFLPIVTRWSDNDVYGHVNNVAYYSFFDSALNAYLIAAGALDIHAGQTIGLVVESGCRFFAPLAYPDVLAVGLRTTSVGRSSVRYELAVFRDGDALCAAHGHVVHVYVDRGTRRPVELSDPLRTACIALRRDIAASSE